MSGLRRTTLAFDALAGWAADDHAAAFAVFQTTMPCLPANWRKALAGLDPTLSTRAYFETGFTPVLILDAAEPLFTGYYEPELDARLGPEPGFTGPIYAPPVGWTAGETWLSRTEIETTHALAGREIAWLQDPVEAFMLQVQGSGRLRLPDGETLRVGYAGKNGHPYMSIGRELVQRGVATAQDMTADLIRTWVRANPAKAADLLRANPSFVFFRALDLDPTLGPLGAAGLPVTAGRTLAIDPAFTPYGAPVWLDKSGPNPITRLMIAQDTGSAIRGAQRADIFFGTGDAEGKLAGQVRETGRMITLIPKGLV